MAIHPLHVLGFEPLLPSLTDLGFEPAMTIGAKEPHSGRKVVQPTRNPAINQALATEAMPAYQASLEEIIRSIPGAALAASRKRKNPSRLAEKIRGEGQPAETVSDYGAAQVAVDWSASVRGKRSGGQGFTGKAGRRRGSEGRLRRSEHADRAGAHRRRTQHDRASQRLKAFLNAQAGISSALGRPSQAAIFPALASGLYFGLRFRCLLRLALAFIFASHEAKYYTNDFPKGDTSGDHNE
jgi:hypothetical protein